MKAVLSKRGWKAKLAAALAAATIAAPLGVAAIAPLVPAVQAYADEAQGQRVESGGWYMNADGTYRYMNTDGSYPSGWKEIDGYWYHFDAEGWAQTGWLWDAGSWYYLNDYGRMIKGGNDWIDGELYYFFEDGRLAQSEAVSFIEVWATAGSEPGEYHNEIHYFCSYYGADGACVHGWAKIPEFTLHRQISDTPESWDDTPFQYRTSIVPGGWIYQDEFGSMCWYWRQIDGSCPPSIRKRIAQSIPSWRQDGASRQGRAAGITLAHPVPCRQAGSMTAEHGIGSRDPERWRQAGRRSAVPGTTSTLPGPCRLAGRR